MLTILLFTALVGFYPHLAHRQCVMDRTDTIVANATEAARDNDVPVGLLLVVGFLESHWGCAPDSGGCWGAPIDPQHRHTAGTAHHAAHALQTSYGRCGSWEGAVSRFRCGLCRCPPPPGGGYTAAFAMRLVERLYRAAETPLPDHLRAPPRPLSRRH